MGVSTATLKQTGFGSLAKLSTCLALDSLWHLGGLRCRLFALAKYLLVLLVRLHWSQSTTRSVELLHTTFDLTARRVPLYRLHLAFDSLVLTLQISLRIYGRYVLIQAI